ncbi:MAG: hypothetical protein IH583_11165, partial [Candidatus Aminicenantes bacterium]|nr:hypothetical protein [Candidatus Aminicenantes bacterium]
MKKALITALAGLCLLQAGLTRPRPPRIGAGLPTGFEVPALETGSPGPIKTGAGLADAKERAFAAEVNPRGKPVAPAAVD